MAVQELPIPTDDEAQQIAHNHGARKHNSVVLPNGQKMACVLLHLADTVTRSNYPAMGTAIKAVTGIDNITLLIDGQTPANTPAETELVLSVAAHLRIQDVHVPDPPDPPE